MAAAMRGGKEGCVCFGSHLNSMARLRMSESLMQVRSTPIAGATSVALTFRRKGFVTAEDPEQFMLVDGRRNDDAGSIHVGQQRATSSAGIPSG